MSVYFIDFQAFYAAGGVMSIKELCIMSNDDIFNPIHLVFKAPVPWEALSSKTKYTNKYLTDHYHELDWDEGSQIFCPSCISKDFIGSVFYVLDKVDGTKMKTLERYFPELNFVQYSKSIAELPKVGENITCLWREHGLHCAYKQCLAMCIDYCKSI